MHADTCDEPLREAPWEHKLKLHICQGPIVGDARSCPPSRSVSGFCSTAGHIYRVCEYRQSIEGDGQLQTPTSEAPMGLETSESAKSRQRAICVVFGEMSMVA